MNIFHMLAAPGKIMKIFNLVAALGFQDWLCLCIALSAPVLANHHVMNFSNLSLPTQL